MTNNGSKSENVEILTALGKVSDQIVEALNKRLVASRYWIKNVESDIHGVMLFRGILHFNSYNV